MFCLSIGGSSIRMSDDGVGGKTDVLIVLSLVRLSSAVSDEKVG